MNSNIKQISKLIHNLKSENEICNFLTEILTESEISTLSKRWRILNMLKEGRTQRDIASELNVSLCKVTRGSRILKNQNSIINKYLGEQNEYRNENKYITN